MWFPEFVEEGGPRYRAIANAIQSAIQNGELQNDQKLPTHRSLADRLGVTTGTITRAYAEAERRGLVYGVVGSGTYVRNKLSLSREWQFLETPEKEGAINFTLNLPLADDRSSMIIDAMAHLSKHPQEINFLLDYQPDIGVRAHRQIMAEWLARDTDVDRWQPDVDQIVITNGGQHGIMLALMSLCRAGDTVLAEALTYPGFATIARQLDLKVIPVVMDKEGITPEALENACKQNAPRALFCTPTLQNPTTATMSLERRKSILEICERYDVMVIEDEVNAGLCDPHPTPMSALMPDRVVHVCGFSKILAAGLRIGCCVVPKSLQARLGAAVRASCWMISPLSAALVCEVLRNGQAKILLERQRAAVIKRTQIACEIFKDYEFAYQLGGLHTWLLLPEPWRADTFVRAAAKRGVEIMDSSMFCLSRAYTAPAVRLSLSAEPTQEKMVQGLHILADLLREQPQESPMM